jgi:hypothetical protein
VNVNDYIRVVDNISDRIKAVRDSFWMLMLITAIIALAISYLSPRDSTDYPDSRSNMELHIDAKTGCHYLSTKYGGIIKRTDKKGKHICWGKE